MFEVLNGQKENQTSNIHNQNIVRIYCDIWYYMELDQYIIKYKCIDSNRHHFLNILSRFRNSELSVLFSNIEENTPSESKITK